MMNFMLSPSDDLLENVKQEWLLPYTYVKREFEMTKAQVSEVLGDLQLAATIKTSSQIIGYLLGIILILLAVFLFWRVYQIKKYQDLEDYHISEDEHESLGGDLLVKKEAADLEDTNGVDETRNQTSRE